MDIRHNEAVLRILKSRNIEGATITELVQGSKLSRDNVRIALAALEGGGRIISRDVGKAKLYRIKDEK